MHTKKTNNTNKLQFCPNKNSKITKLYKKKKKNFFLYRPVLPEIGRYGQNEAGTTGIFSGTKQGGQIYQIAGRYGIFRPYRLVRYEIDNLDFGVSQAKPILN